MSRLMKIPVAAKRKISSSELFWVSTSVSAHHNNCQKLRTLICSDTAMFVYLCLRDASRNCHAHTRENWSFGYHLHQWEPVLPDRSVLTNGKRPKSFCCPLTISRFPRNEMYCRMPISNILRQWTKTTAKTKLLNNTTNKDHSTLTFEESNHPQMSNLDYPDLPLWSKQTFFPSKYEKLRCKLNQQESGSVSCS